MGIAAASGMLGPWQRHLGHRHGPGMVRNHHVDEHQVELPHHAGHVTATHGRGAHHPGLRHAGGWGRNGQTQVGGGRVGCRGTRVVLLMVGSRGLRG
jgi:hypothetical protein